MSAVPSEKRARQREGRDQKRQAQAKAATRSKRLRQVLIVVVVGAVIIGSIILFKSNSSTRKSSSTTSSTTATTGKDAALQKAANAKAVAAGCPASTATRANTLSFSAPPMTIDTSKTYVAHVVTTTGSFDITLDAKAAPTTVNNFVFLANEGYFHCVIFHRVIPGFMDQTGDPTGTGQGGPGYTISDENPPKAANAAQQYPLGSVAMANTGQANTGGSQFFIVAGAQGEGLPNTYALFGTVTTGMPTVQIINKEGNANPSAGGVPPAVTQRILTVTVSSS